MTEGTSPVLVWGAGAMGGTIGATLAAAGHRVRLVDRDTEHVAAIRSGGLRIEGPVFDARVEIEAVVPADVEGRYPLVLLCVKAHHTEKALVDVESALTPQGCVVSIQNGLNELAIARHLGPERTVGAFINFGADLIAPGIVHWGGRGAVVLGELDGRDTPRLQALHTLLCDFEPGAVTTHNIYGYLWGKLAYAALLFATAVTDDAIADVLATAMYRPVLSELAREVCRVASALDIDLEAFDGFEPGAFAPGAGPADAARSLDRLVEFNRGSAKTHSGIWRDLAVRRRKTEVDAQLQPIVEAGREAGVRTPLVERLIVQIHQIEAGARPQDRRNLDELGEGWS